MPDSHDDTVREQFRIQAATFTDEGFTASGLDWIVAQLAPAAGAQVTGTATRDNPLDFEDWMERTQTPAATREEIRERIGRELDGGAASGLRPHRGPDGTIQLTHTWATITSTPGVTT